MNRFESLPVQGYIDASIRLGLAIPTTGLPHDGERYIALPEVMAITCLSEATLLKIAGLERAFPPGYVQRDTGRRVWRYSEVKAWVEKALCSS